MRLRFRLATKLHRSLADVSDPAESAYGRYSASVVARRECQGTRDALGGYVDADHADHLANSSPERRAAIIQADAALGKATREWTPHSLPTQPTSTVQRRCRASS